MMTDRFQRIADLFEKARKQQPGNRQEFLESVCGDDVQMLRELVMLLDHHDRATVSLDEPPSPGFAMSSVFSEIAGDAFETPASIGRYRIVRKIAEGGMGIVYLAEQDEPRREVALKIIKPGMDSRAVIARFEQERQALAVIDHPNVAKVLDAGTTDRGLPYFVMEYVRGEPITEFCDRHRLTIEQRIKLFVRVCEAVQHAHSKGVIHRDLKPSNILVVGDESMESPGMAMPGLSCAPKIIDFGIAKALNQRLTERTIFTEQGQLIGTPEYMSPEQAEMSELDIDTRADVYSLGVVLYELLTDMLPFESLAQPLRERSFAEIQRIIRDVDPPRPSTHVNTLQGDLDWIVMKCLEKDRDRRYATANALALDLRRHLGDQPILARPPSMIYTARKFARRNRALVGGTGLAAAFMILAVAGTSIGLVRTRAAEAEMRRSAEELQHVVEFQQAQLSGIDVPLMAERLRHDLLDRIRSHLSRSVDLPEEVDSVLAQLEQTLAGVNLADAIVKLLDENIFERSLTAIRDQFSDQPLVQARLLRSLAIVLREMGLWDQALTLFTEELDIRRHEQGSEHHDTLTSLTDVANIYLLMAKFSDAETRFRKVLEARRRTLGEDHPDTLRSLNNMSDVLFAQGRLTDAEWYVREAHARTRRILGNEDRETHHAMNNLGYWLTERGELDEAEPYYREVLELRRLMLGNEDPHTLHSMNNLAYLLQQQMKLDEAELLFRVALDGRQRVLGEEHPSTLVSMNNLAGLLLKKGEFAEAEPHYRKALEIRRRVLGDEHVQTVVALSNMGAVLRELGELDEAERHGADAVRLARVALPPDHWFLAGILSQHGRTLAAMQHLEDAEAALLDAHAIFTKALGEHHQRTTEVVHSLADLYDAWHEAEPDARYDERGEPWRAILANQNGSDVPTE